MNVIARNGPPALLFMLIASGALGDTGPEYLETEEEQEPIPAAFDVLKLPFSEKQRSLLGFLYSTPAYWPSLELFGWQDRGQQLLDMTRNGEWGKMPGIVDDEMLECFVLGTLGGLNL